MKTCSKCGIEKDFSEFPKSGGKGGLSSWCKECHSKRYFKNKERAINEIFSSKFNVMDDLGKAKEELGFSCANLSRLLGVHEQTVQKWFRGETLPRPKFIRAMYDIFKIPLPLELKQGDSGRMPLYVSACECCGKKFPVYKSGVKFCSVACSGKSLSRRQVGEGNHAWKGGETRTVSGYIKEKSVGHPFADEGGYVLQHRLVMEKIIGRELHSYERVHHKNGNRQDNRPENLELWVIKGQSKKDPAGTRLIDSVKDSARSLVKSELEDLILYCENLIKERF